MTLSLCHLFSVLFEFLVVQEKKKLNGNLLKQPFSYFLKIESYSCNLYLDRILTGLKTYTICFKTHVISGNISTYFSAFWRRQYHKEQNKTKQNKSSRLLCHGFGQLSTWHFCNCVWTILNSSTDYCTWYSET